MNRSLCATVATLLCFIGTLGLSSARAATLQAVDLRCEYAANPFGVDVAQPRLFWKLTSDTRADKQTAYEVLAASSAELLAKDKGDLWRSGKVKSEETIHIRYAGQPLKSSQQVFWKVRVWDKDRHASPWSAPATWTMGVLTEADWNSAKWIGETTTNTATTLLRREFTVKPGLCHALVHIIGLGQYEFTANGVKAGDDVISPGWTEYTKTCLYDTRDITSLLHEGANAVGIELANGMYSVPGGRYVKFKGSHGPRKAIALVRLEYTDGSVETIITDERWQRHSGPITFSCVFGGEDFDARLFQRGWDAAGFDASKWTVATVVGHPGGKLIGLSAAAPPLKTFEVYAPKKITSITDGVNVYDFGQNAPFIARLKVKGKAGASVRIIPAELVKADGTADRGSSGGGRPAYWQYSLAGDEEGEAWFPKFFYHGSRYFQVELKPAFEGGEFPLIEKLEAVVMHTSSEAVGEFACSNDLFNRIHTLVRWAQRANLVSVLTDCPHRERLGWLEQYHLNGPSLRYEFDLAQLFTKGMNDMADAQLANGLVPNIAPEYVVFGPAAWDKTGAFRDSPEWGSAFILVPWQQYQFTGDIELLRRHYEPMKRYVAYLGSRATNHIVNHGLGDWYDIGPKPPGFAQLTPRALTATAFYQHDTWILSQAAALLGKKAEAKQFAKRAEEIRIAFNKEFFDATNGTYATSSQCANAIPLVMDLCEPQHRAAVLNAIVADVRKTGLTAGDVGYRYLLRALADGGRNDVIFEMNNQSEKPGYGYQLKMGATSLTEAWDARRSSSQNHFMLGQIMEWFYGDLAGIAIDPAAPGFKNVIIKPQPVGDVTWARASFNSVRGRIVSDWQRTGGEFILRVTVPPGTIAFVHLPSWSATSVTESGAKLKQAAGVKFIRQEGDRSVMQVASGSYEFRSQW
ncbi:MAG: family 78 glycoside hydrolase catalytic domain [Verrucomicrobiota bacterium]